MVTPLPVDPLTEERRAAARQALGALSVLVPVGIVAVDADGLSWYHNQRWEDFSGTTGRSLRGRPWYLAVHPDDVAAVADRWEDRVALRGRLGRFRAISSTGVVRECWGETVHMASHDGQVVGSLVVVTDAAEGAVAPAGRGSATAAGLSSAHLLDTVLARSRDIVTIVNPDGSWRWSSGGTLRLVGHRANFDPAEGILPFVHPDDLPVVATLFERARAGDLPPDEITDIRVLAADGSWRQMEAAIDALADDPAVRGFVIHATDVTARRMALSELEASNRRLANLISTVRTALVLEDEERRVLLANQAFVDLFRLGMAPEDLEGRTLASIGFAGAKLVVDPPDTPELFARLIAEHRAVKAARITLYGGRALEYDFVPMVVGETYRGHLVAFRDVTDQVRAEAERERLLASEREENRRLAEVDASRSEFLAAVSHELRTPLTSIVGYTQHLRDLVDVASASEAAECLDTIVRNVDRLLRLAGNLVVLDSMESRTFPLHLVPVDLPELLGGVVRTVAPAAEANTIELVTDIVRDSGSVLEGDADRLEQLFENLLSNAVKFTPPQGQVTVRAAPAGDGWEVEIADTGIGIPEQEQELLFTRFYRGTNARQRGLPGSGLGLSIARAIAVTHGGTMSVRSAMGEGTTVLVRLGSAAAGEGAGGGDGGGGGRDGRDRRDGGRDEG